MLCNNVVYFQMGDEESVPSFSRANKPATPRKQFIFNERLDSTFGNTVSVGVSLNWQLLNIFPKLYSEFRMSKEAKGKAFAACSAGESQLEASISGLKRE